MTKRGNPWFEWKDKINETLTKFSLSEYFHWTPEQIKKMDDDDRRSYIAIMNGIAQAGK